MITKFNQFNENHNTTTTYQEYKGINYPVFDLTLKDNEYLLPKIENFKLKNQLNDYNEKYDLKVDDMIKFISGYNDDIIYIGKIYGFKIDDAKNLAFIIKDSYWVGIDLDKYYVEKV